MHGFIDPRSLMFAKDSQTCAQAKIIARWSKIHDWSDYVLDCLIVSRQLFLSDPHDPALFFIDKQKQSYAHLAQLHAEQRACSYTTSVLKISALGQTP